MKTITADLAGKFSAQPNYLQIRARINFLLDRYLSIPILSGHVADLPQQFSNPPQRPWGPIDWSAISADQIIGRRSRSTWVSLDKGSWGISSIESQPKVIISLSLTEKDVLSYCC